MLWLEVVWMSSPSSSLKYDSSCWCLSLSTWCWKPKKLGKRVPKPTLMALIPCADSEVKCNFWKKESNRVIFNRKQWMIPSKEIVHQCDSPKRKYTTFNLKKYSTRSGNITQIPYMIVTQQKHLPLEPSLSQYYELYI